MSPSSEATKRVDVRQRGRSSQRQADHRATRRRRLGDHPPGRVAERGEEQGIRRGVAVDHVFAREVPGELDPVGHAELAGQALDLGPLGALAHERQVPVARQRVGDDLDGQADSLPVDQATHEESRLRVRSRAPSWTPGPGPARRWARPRRSVRSRTAGRPPRSGPPPSDARRATGSAVHAAYRLGGSQPHHLDGEPRAPEPPPQPPDRHPARGSDRPPDEGDVRAAGRARPASSRWRTSRGGRRRSPPPGAARPRACRCLRCQRK